MVMQKGRDFILRVEDESVDDSFLILGAARTVSFSVNNNPIDITSLNSNGFKELQSLGGVYSLSVKLDGIFKDSNAEELIRGASIARCIKNYQFVFPNGDYIESSFAITLYQRQGTYNGLETFSLNLESSGEYEFYKGE